MILKKRSAERSFHLKVDQENPIGRYSFFRKLVEILNMKEIFNYLIVIIFQNSN